MADLLQHPFRNFRRGAAANGFLLHLLVFILVVTFVYLSNLDWQVFFLLVGWSFGLLLHGVSAVVASWWHARPTGDDSGS